MEKDTLWIFLHLHKTGGTTFNSYLKKYFKPNEELFHLDSKENQLKFNKLSEKEKNKIQILTGHETYYGIHNLIPEKKSRYIAFIRDPAKRLVSQYNHHMSQHPKEKISSFENWYKNYPKNEMIFFFNQRSTPIRKKIQRATYLQKFISRITYSSLWKRIRYPLKALQSKITPEKKLENAKKLLNFCWFVAVTENLNKDLKLLCREIGIPAKWKNRNVAGKKGGPKKLLFLDRNLKEKIYMDNPLDVELYEYAKKLNGEKRKNLLKNEK